jgi:hypothetical protein
MTLARRRLVVVLGLLLLLQTIGLFGLGSSYLFGFALPASFTPDQLIMNLSRTLFSGAFTLLALLALLTTISVLRLQRLAWTSAMAVQGLCLLVALTLYLRERPAFAYFLMLYGLFMVFYLNLSEVQAAFRPRPPILDPRDR